jgi:hypothetical protein
MSRIKIIVDNDVEADLLRLYQGVTYEGLLEGYPNELWNGIIIKKAFSTAETLFGIKEAFLIQPMLKEQEEYHGRRKYQEMPGVLCIGLLKSMSVFKNTKKDFSALAVIWFQDEFAMPVAGGILEKMKAIPYKEVCGEFEI